MRLLASILVLCVSLPSVSIAQHRVIRSKHFLHGYPVGEPATNHLILRDVYALSNNGTTKFADWVAYRADCATVWGHGQAQARVWKSDPWLDPDDRLEPTDFERLSSEDYDRGHQAPLRLFQGASGWFETNYMSNITPQKAGLNRGPWMQLEPAVRELATRCTDRAGNATAVYVMTGPLYERLMRNLPSANEPHIVPSHYWKIVAMDDSDGLRAAAFIMDQSDPRATDICSREVTVDDVETRSSLDFFWRLDAADEDPLEDGTGAGMSLSPELGC